MEKEEYYKKIELLNDLYGEIDNIIKKDTYAIFELFKNYTQKIMGAKNFYVALYNENSGAYSLPYYFDEKEPNPTFTLDRIKNGLTEVVRKTNSPQFITEEQDEELTNKGEVELVGPKAKIWLGVPISTGKKKFGVLAIQDYENENAFTEEDKPIFVNIASMLAFTLDTKYNLSKKKRLMRLTRNYQKASNDISNEIEFRNKSFVFLQELRELIEYRKATIQLIQNEHRILFAFDGFEKEQIDESLLKRINEDPLIMKVLEKQDIYILPNVKNEELFITNHPTTRNVKSWICVPIFNNTEPIALITLDHDKEDFFQSNKHYEIVKLFKNKIERFLMTVHDFENTQLKKRDEEINILLVHTFLKEVDFRSCFQSKFETLIKNRFDSCTAFFPTYSNYQLRLIPLLATGDFVEKIMTRTFDIRKSTPKGLAVSVYQDGKSIVANNPQEHKEFLPARYNYLKVPAIAVFPIKISTRRLGVISISNKPGQIFCDKDIADIEQIVHEIEKIFIDKVGSEFIKRSESRVILNEDDEILKQILASGLMMSGFNSGSIQLISFDNNEYNITNSFDYPVKLHLPKPRIDNPTGLTRQVISGHKSIIIENTKEYKGNLTDELRNYAGTIIIIPINIGLQVIGVMSLFSKMKRKAHKNIINLLQSICNQAAVGIRKVQLLNELKIRNKQLEVFNGLSKYIIDVNNARVFDNFYPKIKSIIDINNFFICLIDHIKKEVEYPIWIYNGEERTVPRGPIGGLISIVIATKKTLLINDYLKEKDILKEKAIIETELQRSWLGVPIMYNDEIIGIISIQNNEPNKFNKQIQRTLEDIATHSAFVVKNIRFFEEIQKNQANKFKEINHRINNNLQMIMNFLECPIDSVLNEQQEYLFNSLKQRIEVIALAHRRLYKSNDVSSINMKDYLSELIKSLKDLNIEVRCEIEIISDIENIGINVKDAIHCGEIVSEIVSNSYKHAFHGRQSGKIIIGLHLLDEDTLELSVGDNGNGYDPSKITSGNTLGLALIDIFTSELQGEKELKTQEGVQVKIKFRRNR